MSKENEREERYCQLIEDIESLGLDFVYASTSLQLAIFEESGIDNQEYKYLLEEVKTLRHMIIKRYMKEHGWVLDKKESSAKWKKEQ